MSTASGRTPTFQWPAVRYRLRSVVRAEWRGMAAMAMLIAALVAVVLAFVAGARRTSSAPDRYTATDTRFDVAIFQTSDPYQRARTGEIAALPEVAAVESMSFVFGRLSSPSVELPQDVTVFSGRIGGGRQRLVAGRLADPTNPHEFVATRGFVGATRARLGDAFHLDTLTQEQAQREGFDAATPEGASIEGVLVGVIDGPSNLDDPAPFAVFSPALLDQNPSIGVAVTLLSVALAPGSTIEGFRQRVETLPRPGEFDIQPNQVVSDSVRNAVGAQSQGLWLLALVAAVASAAVITQLLGRQVRHSPAERQQLQVLGLSRWGLFVESSARAALPAAAGALAGAGLSVVASGRFPTGFVRRLETAPGLRPDWWVAGIGVALSIAILMIITSAVVAVGIALDSKPRPVRPNRSIQAIGARVPSPTAATGIRFAFTRRDRDKVSVRASIVGLVLGIGCVFGVVLFAGSLDRLVDDRARWGNSFDAGFNNGATEAQPELVDALKQDADVAAVSLYASGRARADASLLALVGYERVRGNLVPEVLDGRLPEADDEIALGRLAARNLGVAIDGSVTVTGDESSREMRVTGIVVTPNVGFSDGVGQGGVVTLASLQSLLPSVGSGTVPVVRIRDGAPADTIERLSQETGVAGTTGSTPPAIVNIARVRSIPLILAGLLLALAIVTLLHASLTSFTSRRHDYAVLAALGADRAWRSRALRWQATALWALPVVLGAPLGLAAGRYVYVAFADSIGARHDPRWPWLALGGVAVALLAVANLMTVPRLRARRLRPAVALRAG